MEQYTYLAHYGIKGMKWGERKYQNSDGSLTALGRVHYGVGEARKSVGKAAVSVKEAIRKRVAPTNAELNAQIRKQRSKNLNKEKRKELKALKKGKDDKDDAKKIEDPKGTHKKFTQMDDKELQDQINRLQKELQLEDLQFRTSLSPGKRFVYDVGRDALKQGLTEVAKSVVTSKGKKLFGISDGKKDEGSNKNNGDNKTNNSPTEATLAYRREMEELKARDALRDYKRSRKNQSGKKESQKKK